MQLDQSNMRAAEAENAPAEVLREAVKGVAIQTGNKRRWAAGRGPPGPAQQSIPPAALTAGFARLHRALGDVSSNLSSVQGRSGAVDKVGPHGAVQ